jgi:transposase
LGAALRYFTNHQVALGRFLDYGLLPLDNGIVERLHVRVALTRKHFLFTGAETGGDRAAIAFTILGRVGPQMSIRSRTSPTSCHDSRVGSA